MAGGISELTVRVQRAAEGERFYTWRGRARQLFREEGRLVLNAYLGEELVGSAIVSAHEADEDEQRETAWTLADARGGVSCCARSAKSRANPKAHRT